MKSLVPLVAIALCLASPALAWNHTGHSVIAYLAYQRLPDTYRQVAIAILRNHPHYREYLLSERLEGFSEDQWIFMRAATWPDWVKSREQRGYSHPTWQFINLPYVPAGSRISAPEAAEPNIVTQLVLTTDGLMAMNASQRAIDLCWLLHLVGDIHQPLHCTTLFDEEFPRGDEGGNLALIRIGNHRHHMKLHALWDDLLGSKPNRATIDRIVREINAFSPDEQSQLQSALSGSLYINDWALESFDMAVKYAYLNGRLPLANAIYDPAEEQVPEVSEDYARQAGAIARLQVAKAGARLAALVQHTLH